VGTSSIVKRRFLVIALVVFAAGPVAASAQTGYPSSMAATGDSITRAFNTGLLPYTDAPGNSWSTGALRPWTHYRRIFAANPQIFGRNTTTRAAARA
jgi:hypothetical protein